MIKGIDVSHHNGTVDFAKAKSAGISFVYVKATEGKTYQDPQFQPNVFNALKAGLHVGCYHFARPDHNSPQDEAENFVKTISVMKYDLLPVLDLEVDVKMSGEALYNWARTFVNIVKSKTGHNVMLYTGLWYLNKYPALRKLNDLPLWIAAYRSEAPTVSGWTSWTMWQHTDNANVPGVGQCDENWLKDLNAILTDKPQPKTVAKPSKPAFKRVLKLTNPPMRGDDVRILQKRLNIPADGIFGKLTDQAVRNWQRVHDEKGRGCPPGKGLVVDGIVGEKTWKALFG